MFFLGGVMVLYILKDPNFPKVKTTNLRPAVRVFPFDAAGRIGMVYYDGYDFFGYRNHYESIGGGLEAGENKLDCLKREAMEEAGFVLDNIKEFKVVSDVYGLIKQLNVHFYYTACIIEVKKSAPTIEERKILDSIVFKTIEEWIELFSKPSFGVNALVHQRELLLMKALQSQRGNLQDCSR